jgi:hypothetical protein
VPDDADVILQRFFREGRLLSVPRQQAKRRVVLDHLASSFEPGVRYTENEVNDVLRTVYDDHVALRRYLIDEGFLARDAGIYWRIGGSVEVGDETPRKPE